MLTTLAPATPLAQALLSELDHELVLTRRALERVPEAHFGWQPHAKSMTLGQLASHTADLVGGIANVFQSTELDLTTYDHFAPTLPTSTDVLLQHLTDNGTTARSTLAEADMPAFGQTWTLRHGEHIIMSQSRADTVRHLISHMIHHRGQLSVYLRLLDVPVPSIYGPSADEPSS